MICISSLSAVVNQCHNLHKVQVLRFLATEELLILLQSLFSSAKDDPDTVGSNFFLPPLSCFLVCPRSLCLPLLLPPLLSSVYLITRCSHPKSSLPTWIRAQSQLMASVFTPRCVRACVCACMAVTHGIKDAWGWKKFHRIMFFLLIRKCYVKEKPLLNQAL